MSSNLLFLQCVSQQVSDEAVNVIHVTLHGRSDPVLLCAVVCCCVLSCVIVFWCAHIKLIAPQLFVGEQGKDHDHEAVG